MRLRASRPGQEEWADLVAFLQELCSLVKHLQANQRSQLLQKLTSLGLFEVPLLNFTVTFPPLPLGFAGRISHEDVASLLYVLAI